MFASQFAFLDHLLQSLAKSFPFGFVIFVVIVFFAVVIIVFMVTVTVFTTFSFAVFSHFVFLSHLLQRAHHRFGLAFREVTLFDQLTQSLFDFLKVLRVSDSEWNHKEGNCQSKQLSRSNSQLACVSGHDHFNSPFKISTAIDFTRHGWSSDRVYDGFNSSQY